MPLRSLALVCTLLFVPPCLADTAGTPADLDALKKLKADTTEAVNKRDYSAMQNILHQPFLVTLITQDNFTEIDKLKSHLENLYTRDFLRLKNTTIKAEADNFSQIYQGTFAVNKGSTQEHYELEDGRSFDINGRWTSVSIKENDQWKLLAVHTGTNFLDNPVLQAVEKSVMWTGAIGAAGGLVLGFLLGRLGRKREKAA